MEMKIDLTCEEVLHDVIELCKKYQASRALLYGSRAKGTALERSDIDIAVEGVCEMFRFEDEIEAIPTLLRIDILNMDTCRNSYVLEDIRAYGREIYKAV